MFWVKKGLYFRKVAGMGREQKGQHDNFNGELDGEGRTELEKGMEEVRGKALFQRINFLKFPPFYRLVFNT